MVLMTKSAATASTEGTEMKVSAQLSPQSHKETIEADLHPTPKAMNSRKLRSGEIHIKNMSKRAQEKPPLHVGPSDATDKDDEAYSESSSLSSTVADIAKIWAPSKEREDEALKKMRKVTSKDEILLTDSIQEEASKYAFAQAMQGQGEAHLDADTISIQSSLTGGSIVHLIDRRDDSNTVGLRVKQTLSLEPEPQGSHLAVNDEHTAAEASEPATIPSVVSQEFKETLLAMKGPNLGHTKEFRTSGTMNFHRFAMFGALYGAKKSQSDSKIVGGPSELDNSEIERTMAMLEERQEEISFLQRQLVLLKGQIKKSQEKPPSTSEAKDIDISEIMSDWLQSLGLNPECFLCQGKDNSTMSAADS